MVYGNFRRNIVKRVNWPLCLSWEVSVGLARSACYFVLNGIINACRSISISRSSDIGSQLQVCIHIVPNDDIEPIIAVDDIGPIITVASIEIKTAQIRCHLLSVPSISYWQVYKHLESSPSKLFTANNKLCGNRPRNIFFSGKCDQVTKRRLEGVLQGGI